MKTTTRLLALLLALCMVFAFAACGKDPSDPTDPTDPSNPTTPTDPDNPNPDEPSKEEILKELQKTMLENTLAMQQKNKDTIGWLYIDGTTVNDVVVKVNYNDDNKYYLRRNANGENDNDGCYYADFRCTSGNRSTISKNTVIYGHNLGRAENALLTDYQNHANGPKFAQLLKYQDEEFAKTHPYIYYSTIEEDMVWQVFAVFYTDIKFDYINPNPADATFNSLIKKAQDLSFYDYDVEVTSNDKILTLSTCTYRLADDTKLHYPNDYRYVVMAKLLPADAAFPVTGSSLNSQLTSVPACQSIIKKAVVKRLMAKHHTSVLPETGAEYKIRFMLRKDQCEIMLDTTGDGLHKRGYRRNAMEAPIRETLAATIADLGRVRRDSLVEDPFCGSGTLLIEAAQKAMNIAPGLKRRFAAERYSFVPASLWAEQRQKALAESKLDVGFEAFGYDIDPAAVALANANAKLAGVEKRCHFEVADVADFAAKPEAIVLTNPPYGERMNTIEGAAKLARTLGQQMAEHPCAGLYAITADMEFESHYGKRANKRRKMYNGMIPCQLYMYYEAPKFEHKAKPMPKQGFDGKRTVEFKKK